MVSKLRTLRDNQMFITGVIWQFSYNTKEEAVFSKNTLVRIWGREQWK